MDDELAKRLGFLFIERRDVKAWQQENGGYFPDYGPLTLKDLRSHLAGLPQYGDVLNQDGTPRTDKNGHKLRALRAHMGHYLVSQENKCRLFAFDIDLKKKI